MARKQRHALDDRQLYLPLICSIQYSDQQYLRLQLHEVAWRVVKDALKQLRNDPNSREADEILLWMLNQDSDFESWCATAGLTPERLTEYIRWRYLDQIKRVAKRLVTWAIRQAVACPDPIQKKNLTEWVMDPDSDFREWLALAEISRDQPLFEKIRDERMAA